MNAQFFASEVSRLTALLNERCVKYYEPTEVAFTVEEWKQTLIEDATAFFLEEETMKFAGVKIRAIGSSQGTNGVVVDHGIISYNFSLYAEKVQPFEGLDHAPAVDRDQFADGPEGSAGYFKAQQEQAARLQNIRHQANLLFIRWFDVSGNEVCAGWHDVRTVEVVK